MIVFLWEKHLQRQWDTQTTQTSSHLQRLNKTHRLTLKQYKLKQILQILNQPQNHQLQAARAFSFDFYTIKPFIKTLNQSAFSRHQRLLLRLLQYDIDIQYLPGKRNGIADALSRVSSLPPKVTDIKAINCIAVPELSVNIPASKTKMEEFQDSTCRDIILQELAKTVHKGWPREHKDCPEILHPYWTYRVCISPETGLLFKDNRLIVPEAERDQILELMHY